MDPSWVRKEGNSANLRKIKHVTCPWHTKHFLLIWPTIDTILDGPLGPASCRSQLQPHGALGWWLSLLMNDCLGLSVIQRELKFWSPGLGMFLASFQTTPVVLGGLLWYLGPVSSTVMNTSPVAIPSPKWLPNSKRFPSTLRFPFLFQFQHWMIKVGISS